MKESLKVVDQMSIPKGMKMLEKCLVLAATRDDEGGAPLSYPEVGALTAWFREHASDFDPELVRDVEQLYELCAQAVEDKYFPRLYLHTGGMLWRWFKKLP